MCQSLSPDEWFKSRPECSIDWLIVLRMLDRCVYWEGNLFPLPAQVLAPSALI